MQLETPASQCNDPTPAVVGWAELGRDACHTQAKIQREPPISPSDAEFQMNPNPLPMNYTQDDHSARTQA